MCPLVRTTILVAACALFFTRADAITLDWNAQTWTAGSLSNSYDVDASNAGNDVTVSISGDTAQLGIESTGQQTPALTTNLQGGLPTPENTLTLLLDLANRSQGVVVSISFSSQYAQGVSNVSFTVFDVDFASSNGNSGANFQDELRSIVGIAADGVTQVAPTITVGPNVLLSGSGLNQVATGTATSSDQGAGSGNGNVNISFGSTPITSLSFVYGSGSGTNADPTAQHVGIHDLTFTPVPEINPAWFAGLSCLAAGLFIRRHHARFRK